MAAIVGAVNNDRINDSATWILQDLSKLEIVGNQTVAVSETLGDIQVLSGRPSIEFDLNNGNTAGQINLTLASITRAAGSELRFRVEDAYDSALPFTGAETTVTLLDGGASLAPNIVGGGGAAGSTNMNVVRGVTMDISNNFGGRIATVDGNLLRVLDHNPASATFEFIDATGTQTGGASQLFDSNWNTTNGTDQNVMWYFSQNTPTMSTTVNGADFESGRVIMDDVTVNSVYLTGLSNTQMGGNNNLRRNLVLDDDATMTVSSGVIVVGRQTTSDDATAPGTDRVQNGTNDVFITGGTIDLGQEGFFKNRNGSAVHLNSDIVTGSGGLTWSAPNWTYFDGQMDLGGGDLNIVEGTIHFRFDGNVSNINQVNLETNAGLYIRDGVHLDGLTVVAAPNDNSALGATVTLLRTEGSAGATVSNTDFVMNCFDQLGETFGTMQISMQTNTVMNLDNVNIYSTDPSTRVSSDTLQADPQTFQFFGETSVLNFDGVISDVQIGTGENGTGVLAPINPNDLANTDSDAATPSVPITPNGYGLNGNVADPTNQENQFFRVRIDGGNLGADRFNPYNEVGDNFALNFERSGQQFNGALQVGNGILRFTDSTDDNDGVADGKISFFHDEVANSRDYRDFWTSFRLVDDITGNDNRAVVMMTQPGQVFNIGGGDSRVDTDSGEDNFAIIGYGAITGEATFGDEEYNIGGGFGKRLRVDRELMVYAAGDKDTQGTLNMRMSILDDNGRDGELTKIGRGVVNLRPNAIANEGASNFQFDDGLNMFGGDLVFDFDHGGSTGMQFTSNDTNGASTPDLRFQGGALRILGDTNQTRAWNNIDGNLIVNQGRGEFEYRAQGGNATITAGGTSTNVIRTAGGQLNFVVDTTNIGAGTFKATYQNATISAGSADNVFDSRMGGAFTVGGQADTAVNWAAFDSEWELGSLADAFFNGGAGVGTGLAAFGAGIDTQIEDAVVSTGAATSTGSMRIDAGSTVTFGSAAGSFVVEDGILIPTTNAGAVVFDGPMDLTGTVKTGSATTENELMIHNYGSGGLDIQNVIADNGAKTSLTIGGTGTTTLSGVNTHTGNTYINGGSTVVVDADSDFGVFDTTNGYGIHDVLVYFGGDNYESSAGGTTLDFVAPIPGSAGSGALSGSEVAPTTTIDSPNDLGVRNVLVTAGGSGYTARPIAVFNDTVDATGTNHGQGARAAVVLDGGNVVLNGGTLQVATGFELDSNRSIVLQGDGGTINVADGETLIYQGVIVPERHTSRSNNGSTYAEYFSGDLDINADGSTGTFRLGALIADGTNHVIQDGGLNNIYQGLTNIYAGTVEVFGQPMETQDGDVSGQQSTQSYIQPFGSVASFEDGTIMHENTTLRIMLNAGDQSATAYDGSTTAGNNNLNDTVRIMEWFTFKDGAFIQEGSLDGAADDTNTGRNVSLSGVLQIEDDSTLFIQNEGGNEFLLNDAGGELRGGDTTQLVKLGDSNLRFSASNENFSGQIVIADGFLEANSHGAALGHGTSEILIGSDVAAEGITLPAAYGNVRIGGNVGLVIRDEGGMPGDMIEVTQDIRFLSDTAGENNYYIGAQYMADADVARFSGNIDGTAIASGANAGEQVYFYYVDNYNSRNYGTTSEAERVFIEFTGDITGDFHGRTVTSQGGGASGGFSNTTSGVDNIDEHTYFVFSGDNSAWGSAADRASMEIGLRSNTYDSDRIAFWRAGSDTAFNQYQDMFLKMGSRLQAGGNDVTIGNLVSDADSGGNNNSTIPLNGGVANDGAGTFYAFLENGSNTEGSVTITQTGDHVFTGLIRDGYDPLISSASGELGGEVQNAAELATTEGAALNVVYNGEAEVNLTIATPSTYTGTTIINSGILQAGLGGDGTWNAGATSGDVVGRLGTGDVTVAGGTLAGTGQV
ncbi:MAG: hypothetical protein KDK99_22435, partial [Verrucomicrobiales bacterium]|nr:hypothetical protein [Verrucomicrobiales bacterium]